MRSDLDQAVGGNNPHCEDDSFPTIFEAHDGQLLSASGYKQQFLEKDLDFSRLDAITGSLWWAGRPGVAARPLHRQASLLGRRIVMIEQADLHLVWVENRIFIKPMPRYLLDVGSWKRLGIFGHGGEDTTIPGHKSTRRSWPAARGFLLSYVWLVRSERDFDMAVELGLLPGNLTLNWLVLETRDKGENMLHSSPVSSRSESKSSRGWPLWRLLVAEILHHIDINAPFDIAPRFRYGELRLSRLNHIYRFSPQFRGSNWLRGYEMRYQSYGTFFRRNFSWVFITFAFMTSILSAMQVGLATADLTDAVSFQRASKGFSVLCIVALVAIAILAAVIYMVLVAFNIAWALWFGKQQRTKLSLWTKGIGKA
jgi:hypothetical protein